MRTIISILCVVLGVILGLAAGFGSLGYGIYLAVLLFKGTTIVSFLSILKTVCCIFGATLVGYAVFFIFAAIGGLVKATGK